ncbi:hypothetical protein EPK99_05835 [Neorhizobium lilium]|uniref:Uncharacterized protein n=1 Tax=Neorhizobium lilium TaxID=2503024 RepID=A0A3S3U4J2_9HYPH|nr:hypothetical protein [Neorhizobium lilium]RWX81771.1 hypothetical protein EPK99_05835 [Neorhizobium lilium]
MTARHTDDTGLRDGIASLPERVDLAAELPPEHPPQSEDDANLDEALIETFTASDPIASGRTA